MEELLNDSKQGFVQWLEQQWQIEFNGVRSDLKIQGSPERAVERIVIQDKKENLLVLEKFRKGQLTLKKNIARAVEYLSRQGLKQALTYNKTIDGGYLPIFEKYCFQISGFLPDSGIERPGYLESGQTGKSLARFLIRLSETGTGIEKYLDFDRFSLKEYIYGLFKTMENNDRKVYDRFLPFLSILEKKFMKDHDNLPVRFCHGDFHPLNVIWDQGDVRAVIDWEFAGIKPDVYDAANLVGCAGIENPEGLGMSCVMSFLRELKESGIISEKGWGLLPEFVLALRFAWLSEWLRKNDQEMIEMEHAFMKILVQNMDIIRKGWQIEV